MDEKATQTFQEGIAAFDRRDFEAARVAFLQTFALKPSVPVVRRNLGLAEIYSGHYLDGARRLARVLHTTDEGSAEDRARMLESLRKAEAHLERVTVEVNQDGAEVMIDGVDLGTSPLAFVWYVPPGNYEVRVQKPGFLPFSESRAARAGATQHLRILLQPSPEPAPRLREPLGTVDSSPHARPSPWVLVAGGVLTAAGIAAGAAFSVSAANSRDEVGKLRRQLLGLRCQGASAVPECGDLMSASRQHDRQVRGALVSFTAAGVVGVATLLYGVLAAEDAAPAPGHPPEPETGEEPAVSAWFDGHMGFFAWRF